jgi:hypothetical protein
VSAPRAVFAAILCLAAVASGGCAGAVSTAQRQSTAAQARAEARDILSSRRYTGTTVHGPFRALLDRIGDAARKVGDLIPSLDGRIPGGRVIVWVVLIAIVAAVSWLLATRTGRRRAAAIETAAADATGRRESPAALERRAEAAERAGDYAAALRLRFRAGLLRLDARGLIEYRPSLATATVARALRSPDFDRVAGDFDEIVYGGRPATEDDARASREGWAAVGEGAR